MSVTTSGNSKKKKPRGYVLLEALAGSVILSVSLVSVYHHMGVAQKQMAADAREAQALALFSAAMTDAMARQPMIGDYDSGETTVHAAGTMAVKRRLVIDGFNGPFGARKVRGYTVTVTWPNAQGRIQKLSARGLLPPVR